MAEANALRGGSSYGDSARSPLHMIEIEVPETLEMHTPEFR